MSVINQMLRDLDKRGASKTNAEAGSFAAGRQAVAARRVGSEWFWRVSALLALVAVAWVAWLIWELRPRSLVMEVALRTPRQAGQSVEPSAAQTPSVPTVQSMPRTQSASEPLPRSDEAVVEVRKLGLRLAMDIANPPSGIRAPAANVGRTDANSLTKPAPVPEARIEKAAEARPAAPVRQEVADSAKPEPGTQVSAGEKPRIEIREVRDGRERSDIEYRAAILSLNQGRTARAAEGLRQALAFNPANEGARQALAGIYAQERRFDDAIALLNEGLVFDPRNQAFAMTLARVIVERGDVRGALEVLDRYAGTGTTTADYRAFRAALQQRLGRHAEATEEYRAALAQSPGVGQWWIGLAISQQARARDKEALESFQRARAAGNLTPELLTFVDERMRQLRP